jgi:hypothetical protein
VENNLITQEYRAIPNSWPSLAVVHINYFTIHFFDGIRRQFNVNRNCGGAILNRKTILTTASCLLARVENIFANRVFQADPVFDELNPSLNTIYLTFVGADSYPGWGELYSNSTLVVTIEKIIIVIRLY